MDRIIAFKREIRFDRSILFPKTFCVIKTRKSYDKYQRCAYMWIYVVDSVENCPGLEVINGAEKPPCASFVVGRVWQKQTHLSYFEGISTQSLFLQRESK